VAETKTASGAALCGSWVAEAHRPTGSPQKRPEPGERLAQRKSSLHHIGCSDLSAVAKATDLSRQTIYRIEQDRAAAEAVLATWGQ